MLNLQTLVPRRPPLVPFGRYSISGGGPQTIAKFDRGNLERHGHQRLCAAAVCWDERRWKPGRDCGRVKTSVTTGPACTPTTCTQPGVEVKLATTVDQLLAREIGKTSRIPSIEMSVDFPTQGSCDSGDCFYVNTVSWRNETTPNNTESHPRVVFQRLFGDGSNRAEQRRQLADQRQHPRRPVTVRIHQLSQRLGASDRAPASRSISTPCARLKPGLRLRRSGTEDAAVELPERPSDIPNTFEEHVKLMFDLQALAYQADITR